ncbi:MAG: toll/interleukin-1 receptor domain-containing protein [Henriciella sp.]
MSSNYIIPRNMPRYLKRLSVHYKNAEQNNLAQVIENSKFKVVIETHFDNWNGGQDGHDVIFYVPDELMGLIPLDNQWDIQNKLREDLNKAASAAQGEFVHEVHFEYMDESDRQIAQAPTLDSASKPTVEAQSRLWKPDTIKMFISHRDTSKVKAHDLAEQLENYGISSFVAHDSIEPDEDWQNEIEKALQTMDVLLAFITDDLFDSPWTNQEIGYALARDVPIISIKLERTDPVGFIRNRQAIKGSFSNMAMNAAKIWATITKRFSGKAVYRMAVLKRFASSNSFARAGQAFDAVTKLPDLTQAEMDAIISAYNQNDQISGCYAITDHNRFLNFINRTSSKSYEHVKGKVEIALPKTDDDMPF